MKSKKYFRRNANKIPILFYQLYDFSCWMKNQASKSFPLSLPSDYNPFFIIGSGRSGTTLMRSILVSNTSIAIPPESYILYKVFRKYSTYKHLGWKDLSRLIISEFESHEQFGNWNTNLYPCYQKTFRLPEKERSLARIVEIIYMQYIKENNPTAEMWGDKTPFNLLYINWINKLFPKAKYIHMLRDGRDVVTSLIKSGLFTNIDDACWRWKTSVEKAEKLRSLVGEDYFLETRYESLVSDAKNEVKRICIFLGVEFTSNMLNPQHSAKTKMQKTIKFPHHKNLLKPINITSIGKWESELDESQKIIVHNNIGRKLEQLNYL